jgi:hypothetical protein
MANEKLITVGVAMAGDILGYFGLTGGNMASVLATAWIEDRRKKATDVFIEAIRNGVEGPIEFDAAEIEPFLEVVHRFNRAVEDGAALENLRLLAKIIAGLKKTGH